MVPVLLRMLVGGLAGFVAWGLIEPTNPGLADQLQWGAFEQRLTFTLAALIGLAVGGLNGYYQGSRTHLIRGLLLGGLLGLFGASFGYGIGGRLAQILFGGVRQEAAFPILVLSRFVALAPMGAGLGAAIGFSSLDWRRAVQGAIGGAIGAGAGALVFDVVGGMFAGVSLNLQGYGAGQAGEVGQVPRALLATSMGACIGLFIGIVELAARTAWVRLVLGRNEGREWSISAPQSVIGRNETAQIPLFGDPGIAPLHATILRQGNHYLLADAGSGLPTFLNGQPVVGTVPLFHGAQIQVGKARLEFLLRGGRADAPAHVWPTTPVGMPTGSAGVATPVAPNPTVGYPAPMLLGGSMQPTVAIPAARVPNLVAVDGPLAGQRVEIANVVELGRESPWRPLGFDASASRRHASLSPSPMGVVVTDLGSTNGTFVNGQRIQQPTTIRPGDLVRIGATTFRIE